MRSSQITQAGKCLYKKQTSRPREDEGRNWSYAAKATRSHKRRRGASSPRAFGGSIAQPMPGLQTSSFQNCRRINFCLKAPSSW